MADVKQIRLLIGQYNSLSDIPKDKLDELNYEVIEEEDGPKLKLKNSNSQNLQIKKNKKVDLFGELELIVLRNPQGIIQIQSDETYRLFEQKLKLFVRNELSFTDSMFNFLAKNESLSRFRLNFSKYLNTFNDSDQDILYRIFDLDDDAGASPTPTSPAWFGLNIDSDTILNLAAGTELEYATSEKAEIDIEELISKLKDDDELKRIYYSRISGNDWSSFKEYCDSQSKKEIKLNYLAQFYNGEYTVENVFIHHISDYFKMNLLDHVARGIASCNSIDEVEKYLSNVGSDKLTSFYDKKQLTERIKDVSPKEKSILSQKLKEAKFKLGKEKQIVDDVKTYLNGYKLMANKILKKFKSFINLIYDENDKIEDEKWTLDGRINEQLDKNPGEVSGDCTNKSPLPFYRPDTHNLKLFNSQNIHRGNIYLLETKQQKSNKRVWHLDAIQLPQRSIDANIFLKQIILVLSNQAKQKGIDYITINQEQKYRSNYDFIQEASENFLIKRIKITKPNHEISERTNSKFQGSEKVYAIWENN